MPSHFLQTIAVLFAVLVLPALPAGAGENLVKNSDFTKKLEHWKTSFPEPNETKYAKNDQWVSVVDAPEGKGKALHYTINGTVAASEGVKTCTELIPVDGSASYEFGCDVYTKGTAMVIFLEGYQKDPIQTKAGDDKYPGFARSYRATIFPKNGPNQWAPQSRVVNFGKQPAKYKPTHVLIKLYAFYPEGEVFFRNVFLRKVDGPAKSR